MDNVQKGLMHMKVHLEAPHLNGLNKGAL